MKKLFSFLISITLFIYLIPYAYASQSEVIFSDIDKTQWFYNDIVSSKKYKVINGYEDGSFKPFNDISHIEALKISVLSTMTMCKQPGVAWDSKYIESAHQYGLDIIENEKALPITRYEFFFYIYQLLSNKYEFDYEIIEKKFADYNDRITTFLYRSGILQGINENGTLNCFPNKTLTRAEAIAISNRVISFVFSVNAKDFIIDCPQSPIKESEIRKAVLYAGIHKLKEVEFKYPMGTNYKNIAEGFLDDFNKTRGEHYEYFSNVYECNTKVFGSKNNILIKIYFDIGLENNDSEIDRFFDSCRKINDYLWNSGTLNLDMTQKEMAKEIFKYICVNYQYDVDGKYVTDIDINQGNKMIDSGSGICMGYTVIFNQLCKLNGIKSVGVIDDVDGVGHIYSKSLLDGDVLFSDVTFGDPTPDEPGRCREKWFGLTVDEMSSLGRNLGRDFIEKFDIGRD